jgi:hypothetical protein
MSARTYLPALADITAIVEEECTARGAPSVDCYCDEQRLIARAIFGPAQSVQPGDEVRGGIAVRATGPNIFVHPFTWRQVCTNGAIAPMVLGTQHVERIEVEPSVASAAFVGGSIAELRAAIDYAAAPERLTESVGCMRGALEADGALAITILPHLLHVVGREHREYLLVILERHTAGDDHSAYGLFNAVTSVARDTDDPETRWRLEEVGGILLHRIATKSLPTLPAAHASVSV